MVTLKENHLEWALKHLLKYSDSDFYPKIFEFKAISHNWNKVKEYILSLDLSTYTPKSPVINLAPKPNGNFRVAHQLEPIDSLIYNALIREVCEVIEDYRIPDTEKIACSYRIRPDLEGSYFDSESGWETFISRSEELVKRYDAGFVIIADITDFYNQIYTHRINNLIEEAGKGEFDEQAVAIDNFLMGLNKRTSRGIPVGPAPSIILSELIMADIDNKISNYTNDFIRYMDDIRIFCDKFEEAVNILHELTKYLYSYHRLVFAGDKTKVVTTEKFRKKYMRSEEKEENAAVMAEAENLALGKLDELFRNVSPYSSGYEFSYEDQYEKMLEEIMENEKFQIISSTYYKLLEKSLNSSLPIDFGLLRHLIRKAAKYRIRNLSPILLDNFERMLPLIREVVIYLNAVINRKFVANNKQKFVNILSAYYMKIPFVNLWISYLLENPSFNEMNLPESYDDIISVRGKALIALRRKDSTWVKGFRDGIDALGLWDKRAVVYSSSLLSFDEMSSWCEAVGESGDIVDEAISAYIISQKKQDKYRETI